MAAEQKNLVLILARELAANLATPAFVVEADGTLVFFNEAGAAVLGQTFGETGELPPGEWGTQWDPRRDDGTPFETADLPLMQALARQRPAHDTMTIEASDGARRSIAVTAVPLFATPDDPVGALAIFWER